MGASASNTRRLTVNNDTPRIIQVTEDVVNRLKSAPAPQAAATLQPSNLISSESAISNENVDPSAGSVNRDSHTAGILNVGIQGRPVIETVSAFQVRQQKEKELRRNDDLWLSKLRELEIRYASSAFASQEEFGSKLEKLKTLVPQKKEKRCQTQTAKVAECYAANPSQPLRCSEEVKNFANCVDGVRAA